MTQINLSVKDRANVKILLTFVRPSVRYLFYQALFVNLDKVPVALPFLREISESRLKLMEMVEPRKVNSSTTSILVSGVWLTRMVFLEDDWTVAEQGMASLMKFHLEIAS